MKKDLLFIGLLAIIVISCGNNKDTASEVQNNTYVVTMEGIDSLKLGMTKSELEKLLKTKIPPSKPREYYSGDTVTVKYMDIDMILFFDGSSDSTATVRGILTSSASCRTAKGIGIGSEKMKVIDAYEDHTKYVAPEYEEYPVRSTTKSAIAVMDTVNSNALIFHIVDKKVSSIEVHSYYEFY